MTNDNRDLQLDLEPRDEGKGSFWELLVPMHPDNFALALASGYVGGSLKDDAAADIQVEADGGLACFHDLVPSWAISEGEPGERVVLALPRQGREAPAPGSIEVLHGPVRVTEIKSVYFKDHASLANFQASYEAFPDVAEGIAIFAVKWPVREESERPADTEIGKATVEIHREDLDFFGGLGVGIIQLLSTGKFDDALCQFLQDPGDDLEANAKSLLCAFEPSSSAIDIAIWCAALQALRARFGKRGFDRRQFLQDVEERLGGLGTEAESWVRGCQEIIDAERDIPSLADSEKIGRRAVLAIILSHEPAGLDDLEDNLEVGPKVKALVTAAVYAFSGLSRADKKLKSPAMRMEAILQVGERIATGKSVKVEIKNGRIANDLTRHQSIAIDGAIALEREVEPPAYMVMLKARIQEAGYKVELDGTSGQLGIRPAGNKGEFILVEDCRRSEPGNPIVNLVLPIGTLGARPTIASLKKLMSGAWEYATTVAIRMVDGNEEIVAMASLPLATLDRDELNFHVDRLLSVSADLGGRKRKPRRIKKTGA